ncbi:MAG: DNA polymerase III subunit epsilon [Chlamydiae bacterium]|nr:DNA polymerase III subunit epsilon [Chlamydiota bacterium]
MALIKKEIFVCLDCESTGLEPDKDRIIEIAVARFTFDQVLEQFETLIDPECEIPTTSQNIHKITKEMLTGQPKIAEVLPRLLKMIDGHILVGHGIGFDIALVAAEAKRYNIPSRIDQQVYLDTLRMARLYGESPVNSLQYLRHHFNIASFGAHRAMSDVIVNIEVFKHLAKPYQTTDELFQTLQKPIRMKTMPLGKHKGRRFEEIPLEYLLWAERKDFDQDLLFSIRCELKSRKKGGKFEQASNPFSNL